MNLALGSWMATLANRWKQQQREASSLQALTWVGGVGGHSTRRLSRAQCALLEILGRLTELGIPIVPQVKLVNNWMFDAAVNGTRIIIEVKGDYWHNLARNIGVPMAEIVERAIEQYRRH